MLKNAEEISSRPDDEITVMRRAAAIEGEAQRQAANQRQQIEDIKNEQDFQRMETQRLTDDVNAGIDHY